MKSPLQHRYKMHPFLVIAEYWPPESGELKVGIALHTGWGEARDNDDFGPPVNRVAWMPRFASGRATSPASPGFP